MLSSKRINDIKLKIQEKENIPHYNQELTFNGKRLSNMYRLDSYYIQENSTLYLSFKENKEMAIYVKTLTGKTITIYAKPTDYLSDLKLKIKDKVNSYHKTLKEMERSLLPKKSDEPVEIFIKEDKKIKKNMKSNLEVIKMSPKIILQIQTKMKFQKKIRKKKK